jgi:hypothetical protein
MRRVNVHMIVRLRPSPAVLKATAGKRQGMRTIMIDDGKLQVAV